MPSDLRHQTEADDNDVSLVLAENVKALFSVHMALWHSEIQAGALRDQVEKYRKRLRTSSMQVERLQEMERAQKWSSGDYQSYLNITRDLLAFKKTQLQKLEAQNGQTEIALVADQLTAYLADEVEALLQLREHKDAERSARLAIEGLKQRNRPMDHFQLATIQRKLCEALSKQGTSTKLDEARSLHRSIWDCTDRANRIRNGDHYILSSGHELAVVLQRMGKKVEAELVYKEVWKEKVQVEAIGPLRKETWQSFNGLVELVNASGAVEKAMEIRQEYWDSLKGKPPPPEAHLCLRKLAIHHYSKQKYGAAEPILRYVLDKLEASSAASDSSTDWFKISYYLASSLFYQGTERKLEEAEAVLQGLWAKRENTNGGFPSANLIGNRLAWTLRKLKAWEAAEEIAKTVYDERHANEQHYGPKDVDTLKAGANYGFILIQREAFDSARKFLRDKVINVGKSQLEATGSDKYFKVTCTALRHQIECHKKRGKPNIQEKVHRELNSVETEYKRDHGPLPYTRTDSFQV